MSTQQSQPRKWRDACRLGGIVLATVLCLLLTGDQAHAEDGTKQLKEVLENARLWIVGIAGVLVAVMVTIAGIRYLLGGGDPGETEKAKTALRAALIGLAIVLLAPAIVAIVKGILGVD